MPPGLLKEEALLDMAEAIPEFAPFVWFNIELSDGTPLWEIVANPKPQKDYYVSASTPREKEEREIRVALLAESMLPHIEANNMRAKCDHLPSLDTFEDESIPASPPSCEGAEKSREWENFWGGASPTEIGHIP